MLKFKEVIKLTPEQKLALINKHEPSSIQRMRPSIYQAADVVADSSTSSPTN